MRKFFLLLLFILPTILFAQDSIKGKANFTGDDLVLGQVFYLEIEVIAPKSFQVLLPDLSPSIEGLEAMGIPLKQEKIEYAQSYIYKKSYPYIAFDSVSGKGGPFEVNYLDAQDVNQILRIPPAYFQVSRVSVDSTDAYRIAYGPISKADTELWSAFFWVLAILVLIIASILIAKWVRGGEKLSIPKDVDPRIWALQQIEKLEQQVPFQDHQASWVRLIDTLRLYLEKAWKVPAPYFSTGELLGAIAKNEQYSSQLTQVAEVLEIGDQIKFAKRSSKEEEQNEAIRKSKSIILFDPQPFIQTDTKKEEGDG